MDIATVKDLASMVRRLEDFRTGLKKIKALQEDKDNHVSEVTLSWRDDDIQRGVYPRHLATFTLDDAALLIEQAVAITERDMLSKGIKP